MKKIVILASAFALSSPLVNANTISPLMHQPITFNSCYYKATGGMLDAALLTPGFFVVKRGNSEKPFFTRYGSFSIDNNKYLIDSYGQFLQGIDIDASIPVLLRIRINTDAMEPKATHWARMTSNFDARDEMQHLNYLAIRIYDALGNPHTVNFDVEKISNEAREVKISIDDQYIRTGKIIFNEEGKLKNEVNMENIKWQSPQGEQELSFFFWGSTQYPSDFNKAPSEIEGNPSGTLMSLTIGDDGNIFYHYSNGKSIRAWLRIAVATFSNPEALENLFEKTYVPTKASGMPSIKAENSYGAFLPGYLQDDFCIPQIG